MPRTCQTYSKRPMNYSYISEDRSQWSGHPGTCEHNEVCFQSRIESKSLTFTISIETLSGINEMDGAKSAHCIDLLRKSSAGSANAPQQQDMWYNDLLSSCNPSRMIVRISEMQKVSRGSPCIELMKVIFTAPSRDKWADWQEGY